MGRLVLSPDESVLVVGRPALVAVWPKYLLTAGLYGLWHKRNISVLTDRRVILGSGILYRRETSIPLHRIDDAEYLRKGLRGYCQLGTLKSGSWRSLARIGPLPPHTARRITQELQLRI